MKEDKFHINYDNGLCRWNIWLGHEYICHGNTPEEAWQKLEEIAQDVLKIVEDVRENYV